MLLKDWAVSIAKKIEEQSGLLREFPEGDLIPPSCQMLLGIFQAIGKGAPPPASSSMIIDLVLDTCSKESKRIPEDLMLEIAEFCLHAEAKFHGRTASR